MLRTSLHTTWPYVKSWNDFSESFSMSAIRDEGRFLHPLGLSRHGSNNQRFPDQRAQPAEQARVSDPSAEARVRRLPRGAPPRPSCSRPRRCPHAGSAPLRGPGGGAASSSRTYWRKAFIQETRPIVSDVFQEPGGRGRGQHGEIRAGLRSLVGAILQLVELPGRRRSARPRRPPGRRRSSSDRPSCSCS